VAQLQPNMEIVIVDGASPDDTQKVVASYTERYPNIRYIREETNSGVDADYDKAVSYARGTYCWLFPDDDLLQPGALVRVMQALEAEPELVVVDASVRDASMRVPLAERRMKFSGQRRYTEQDGDAFMADAADALSFIGATIIRRDVWLARDRTSYYGSLFIHVGVIFQKPLDRIIVIAEPLIAIRFGNAMWTPRTFEIWMFKWPELIWGFSAYSAVAKRAVCAREPWRNPLKLIGNRANGAYSLEEYNRFFRARAVGLWRLPLYAIAALPGVLANVLAVCLFLLRGRRSAGAVYIATRASRFSNPASRMLAWLALRPVRS
jgi:abequosyltransferase